jgi:hypothetical protein
MPSIIPSSVTVTVALGSPVPPIVGVESLVRDPFGGVVIATEVVVSMTIVTVSVDTPPEVSVARAVNVLEPSAMGAPGVNVHAPKRSAVTVPRVVPPTEITTVAPGSAVPVRVGVESAVRAPSAGVVIDTSTRHVALHPSPEVVFRSSQVSRPDAITPSPHVDTHTDGSAAPQS